MYANNETIESLRINLLYNGCKLVKEPLLSPAII